MKADDLKIQFAPVPEGARWQVLIERGIATLDVVSINHTELDVAHDPDDLGQAVTRRALELFTEGNAKRIGAPIEDFSVSSWEQQGSVAAERALEYHARPYLARAEEKRLDPAAAQRVTVEELIARLRLFPQHLQVWSADPTSREGYAPLDGTAALGADPDPGSGDPSTFVVLGKDDSFGTQAPSPLANEGHLRGIMVDGYSPDDVNRVLGRLSDVTGLLILCVWDYYDDYGFGGNSDFYVNVNGRLHYCTGDLWPWLNGSVENPDTPPDPGTPASWVGELADLDEDQLPYTDGQHNYTTVDRST